MKLIQPLTIYSNKVALLTELKKGKLSLIDTVNMRIAQIYSRVQREELLAVVDLQQMTQLLTVFEHAMRAKEKDYRVLIESENPSTKKLLYKPIKTVMCHIGTPVHSLWTSCLDAMDKVFCAIYVLKVHHASVHRVQAGGLIRTLFDECLRWVFKLLYLPKRDPIGVEEFLELPANEQSKIFEKNKVSLEKFKEAILENPVLLENEMFIRLKINLNINLDEKN